MTSTIIKIHSKFEAEITQKELFSRGYAWRNYGKKVKFTEMTRLIVYSNFSLGYNTSQHIKSDVSVFQFLGIDTESYQIY